MAVALDRSWVALPRQVAEVVPATSPNRRRKDWMHFRRSGH
jgi:hypothetical protein